MAAVLLLDLQPVAHAGAPLWSIEELLQGPRILDAAISPDGRYISLITLVAGESVVVVHDRRSAAPAKVVLTASRDSKMTPAWCAWGNETRLVCGYRGLRTRYAVRDYTFSATRLVAVNADGSQLTLLMNQGFSASQQQDQIVDWTPADPRSVLIQYRTASDYPSVFALDIYSGKLSLHTAPHPPIQRFISDQHGNVRLGGATGMRV